MVVPGALWFLFLPRRDGFPCAIRFQVPSLLRERCCRHRSLAVAGSSPFRLPYPRRSVPLFRSSRSGVVGSRKDTGCRSGNRGGDGVGRVGAVRYFYL